MGSECVLTAAELEKLSSKSETRSKLPSVKAESVGGINPNLKTPSRGERLRDLVDNIDSDVEAPSDQNLGYVNPAAPEPSYTPSEVRIKDVAQHEPEGYSRDVRSAFSGLPKVKPQWRDYYMKMLIVGECGQGKTTFIKNLFASYTQDPNMKVNDVPGSTSKETFLQHPDKLLTEIVVRDERNMVAYHYQVQDTPGYDNMEVNLDPVIAHIQSQNLKNLEHEQNAKREAAMSKWQDPRVDVCVYFIAPHRLKQIDVEFMKRLSLEVPVLPVLAKADCMTAAELASFREHVRNTLYHASKEIGRPIVHEFSPDALEEAGATHLVPPFSVVASNTMDLSVGRFWPVREYPWGSCEVLSSRHSDLAALKKLLFEVSYMELKDATESRYYHYRETQLLDLDDSTLPVSKGTLTRQLRNLTKQPNKPTKHGLLSLVGSVAKFAIQGGLVYLAVTALQGQQGRQRIREDIHAVADKSGEFSEVVQSRSHQALDKSKEAGHVVSERARQAKDWTEDTAASTRETVEDAFSHGSRHGQRKAEDARREAEAEQERQRAVNQAERERQRSKKGKKFGLF